MHNDKGFIINKNCIPFAPLTKRVYHLARLQLPFDRHRQSVQSGRGGDPLFSRIVSELLNNTVELLDLGSTQKGENTYKN